MEKISRDTVFCSACGTKNTSISSFCSNCGSELVSNKQNTDYKKDNTNIQSNVTSNTNNYSDSDDIMKFVEKNTQFYQNKFDTITKTGSKITWNWAAFFLNIYWLLYRKMYLQAGGLFLITITKEEITTDNRGDYHRSDKIMYSPSTLGFQNHNFDTTTLASAQSQPSTLYPATTQDGTSVALFRAAGDGAPPQLKRNIGSIDSAMDAQ